MRVPSLYSLPLFGQATSAVNGYPNGLGPVSRTLPVGGWYEDSGLSGLFAPAVDTAGVIAKEFLQSQLVRGIIAGKKAIGYTEIETVLVNGKPYVKMLNTQKVPVLIDDQGRETYVTAQTQAAEQRIDSSGRIITGTAIGLGIVAIGALLFFMLRRK